MAVTRTYFMIDVVDMGRAVTFYRGVLGTQVVRHESPSWSELKIGETTVALHAAAAPHPRFTALAVEVEDLRATYDGVLAHGGRVVDGPFTEPNGHLSYEVADTEGNTFTLASAVPLPDPTSPPAPAG